MSLFERICQTYGRFLRGCGFVAGYTTFAMMLLVVANAASRFLFNAPVQGALEITETMLTVLVFLSLALTQYEGGHIKVTVVLQHLPTILQKPLRLFVLALGCVFFAWCAQAGWDYAMKSLAINEQQWGSVRYPLYPVKFVIFFGLAMLAIQFALDFLRELLGSAPEEEAVGQ